MVGAILKELKREGKGMPVLYPLKGMRGLRGVGGAEGEGILVRLQISLSSLEEEEAPLTANLFSQRSPAKMRVSGHHLSVHLPSRPEEGAHCK